MASWEKDGMKQFLTQLISQLMLDHVLVLTDAGIRVDSNLIKSFEYKVKPSGVQVSANFYYDYVDRGRKALVKKVPIKPLIRWMKRYGIRPKTGSKAKDYLKAAFAIQNAIYKNGIVGKKYHSKLLEKYGNTVSDELADYLVKKIMVDVVDALTLK